MYMSMCVIIKKQQQKEARGGRLKIILKKEKEGEGPLIRAMEVEFNTLSHGWTVFLPKC